MEQGDDFIQQKTNHGDGQHWRLLVILVLQSLSHWWATDDGFWEMENLGVSLFDESDNIHDQGFGGS